MRAEERTLHRHGWRRAPPSPSSPIGHWESPTGIQATAQEALVIARDQARDARVTTFLGMIINHPQGSKVDLRDCIKTAIEMANAVEAALSKLDEETT